MNESSSLEYKYKMQALQQLNNNNNYNSSKQDNNKDKVYAGSPKIIRKSVTRDLNLRNNNDSVLERDQTYKLFKKIIEQEQIENR